MPCLNWEPKNTQFNVYILGISAYYHDSAACLLKDGKIVFAAQEERFTRKKHDDSFPINAVNSALSSEGIEASDIDLVIFYEKPFSKFKRIIDTYARNSPRGFWSFRRAMKAWLGTKLWMEDEMRKILGYKGTFLYAGHHESHAASAFYSSPFDSAAVLNMDGVGESSTTSIWKGNGNQLEAIEEQHFPHSLGLFYSAFTYYCGFKVNSGEYKLMGLAPYGKPVYADLIKEHFISWSEKGEIKLNLSHYNYETGSRMLHSRAYTTLGRPPRKPEAEMDAFYMDIAASVQKVTEEIVIAMSKYALKTTGTNAICLAGGVALNCKANGELFEKLENSKIWVQPAAGDAGGAVGAALVAWYGYLKKQRETTNDSPVDHVYLGPDFGGATIEAELTRHQLTFHPMEMSVVAEALENKKVVGWFQGRMEFGPRALGNRSILASPLYVDMKTHVNRAIKKREGFRPFAPVVKEDEANEWFSGQIPTRYMLFTVNSDRKSQIPSCIHEDGTARLQTVRKDDNERLYELLDTFEKKTGCPVLINTSFNVRGEPIVCTPLDAIRCFFQTDMDVLALGNYVLFKTDNTNPSEELMTSQSYELD